MRQLKSLPVCCFLGMLGMSVASALAGGQQPLNWAADDSERVAILGRDGSRLDGEHVILWFPKSLAPPDAAALVKRLDPGVAALWRRVGIHEWQAVPKTKITYYLSEDSFVAHASGRAAVFIPMARVQDGRAPYLHEAAHEMLASTRTAQPPAGTPIRRPLWLTEGLPDYLARLATADVGTPEETGPFGATLAQADALCAERARTPDGATMISFIGTSERPEALFTTDRSRFAPTFYTCSLSFVRYLGSRLGLDALVGLFAHPPAEMIARLDTLGGKRVSAWRADWLRALTLQPGDPDHTVCAICADTRRPRD